MSCCERSYDKRSEWGVTLVEVILVVAIIAIMSGMAITSLTSRDAELKSAAYELSTNLMQARLRAIKQNESVRVAYDDVNESYNATLNGTELIYNIKLKKGLDLDVSVSSTNFTSLGTAFYTKIGLIGSTGQKYEIIVSSTGNIKVN